MEKKKSYLEKYILRVVLPFTIINKGIDDKKRDAQPSFYKTNTSKKTSAFSRKIYFKQKF